MSPEKKILISILEENTSYMAYRKLISEQLPEIHEKILSYPYSYAENLWLFLNDRVDRPVCACGKILKYIDRSVGYRKFCSSKCAANDPEVIVKKQQDIPTKSSAAKKRGDTMQKRYGVRHALQNKELNQKFKESYSKTFSKSGSKIKEKRKASYLKKYGVDNIWDSPEFRKKFNNKVNEKYGVDWVQQNTAVVANRVSKLRDKNYVALLSRFPDVILLTERKDYTGLNAYMAGRPYEWSCKNCGTNWVSKVVNGEISKCPQCFPAIGQSMAECEIADFLNELCVNFVLHDRQLIFPKELDFVLPNLKIAIEFCGLYWHSDKKVDKDYHRLKYTKCLEIGYRLITIFEDEWNFKKDICKDRIKHAVGLNAKIFARNCSVSKILDSEARKFIEKHHIQDYAPASVHLGLIYKDKIVAVMTLGNRRKILNSSHNTGSELIRFCSDGSVVGGASKLFNYFVKNYQPQSVISYCDLRWGQGKTYENMGFNKISDTKPGYWYTDGIIRKHRYNFTKQSLVKKGYDPLKTEEQIMIELGFYKIWDCGNTKFEWTNNNHSNSVIFLPATSI